MNTPITSSLCNNAMSNSSEGIVYERNQVITSTSLDHSVYGHLVVKNKSLIVDRVFIPWKLHRSHNSVADCMTRYSRSKRGTTVWLNKGPHVPRNSCRHIVALPI